MGVEPTLSAWKAEVLPLNYARVGHSPPQGTPRALRAGRAGQSESDRGTRAPKPRHTSAGVPAQGEIEGAGGERRIRTAEGENHQIYSLAHLAALESPPVPAPRPSERFAAAGAPPAHAPSGAMRQEPLPTAAQSRTGAGVPVPGSSADAAGPWASHAQREPPAEGASSAVRRPREASAPVSSVRLSRFHGTARRRGVGGSLTRAARRSGGSGRDRSCFEVFRAATTTASWAGARWSRRWESNPQPPDYKSGALPIEPRRRLSTRGEARGRA